MFDLAVEALESLPQFIDVPFRRPGFDPKAGSGWLVTK
jgi:hypothetical protein